MATGLGGSTSDDGRSGAPQRVTAKTGGGNLNRAPRWSSCRTDRDAGRLGPVPLKVDLRHQRWASAHDPRVASRGLRPTFRHSHQLASARNHRPEAAYIVYFKPIFEHIDDVASDRGSLSQSTITPVVW